MYVEMWAGLSIWGMFRPSQAQREEVAADAFFLSVFIHTHMYTLYSSTYTAVSTNQLTCSQKLFLFADG